MSKGILVPSYYPFWTPEGVKDYERLSTAAAQLKHATLIAIINPSSGPLLQAQDASWFNQRKAFAESLTKNGHHALGYVSTKYGRRPLEDVAQDVRLYAAQGVVNGIFFDEVTELYSGHVALVQAARASFSDDCYIALNCGKQVPAVYDDHYVITITAETDADTYFDRRANKPAKDDAIILHGYSNTDWADMYKSGKPNWMYASHIEYAPKNDVWGSLHPAFEMLCKFVDDNVPWNPPSVVIDPDPHAGFLPQLSYHLNELLVLVRDEQARVSKSV